MSRANNAQVKVDVANQNLIIAQLNVQAADTEARQVFNTIQTLPDVYRYTFDVSIRLAHVANKRAHAVAALADAQEQLKRAKAEMEEWEKEFRENLYGCGVSTGGKRKR